MDGHDHELHPHSHVSGGDGTRWCSARYWCAGCRTWLTGTPCKGARSAIPSLPGIARKTGR